MKTSIKRKKIYAVAIALLAIIVTAVFAGCTAPKIDVKGVEVDVDGIKDTAYGYLQTLSGEGLNNRTLGTQGALDCAKYISDEMIKLGYAGAYSSEQGEGLQEFKTSFKRFDGAEITNTQAYNVIFTKKSDNEKSKGEIILACSYDNLYSEKSDISGSLWSADGSYESGASIAVALTLAGALKDKPCDYDLTFAFFTGGCYEWRGAMNYVDNLDRTGLDKIALVLNFATLGGGDNWYIYSGESANDYGRYLNACAEGYVTAVPKDRNIGQFALTENSKYNYANIGMLSNHYFFDLKNVPTANVLSLNWGINDNPLFSEMKGKDNIYHTKNDTLQNMIERKGEDKIKAQLFEIVRSTLTALDESNQETLVASLDVAKSQLTKAGAQNGKSATLANIIIKVVLIAILIAMTYIIKTNLTKNFDKYAKAKKANEEGERDDIADKQPFETDNTHINAQDTANSQKAEEKKENNQEDDPFI
ncbi:MAG: M28 family peptidase [Clostridia bacterium]|nr:M28 family peptidase [Clostridia bacterium]